MLPENKKCGNKDCEQKFGNARDAITAYLVAGRWLCPACALSNRAAIQVMLYYMRLVVLGKKNQLHEYYVRYISPGNLCFGHIGKGDPISPAQSFLINGRILCPECLFEQFPEQFQELIAKLEEIEALYRVREEQELQEYLDRTKGSLLGIPQVRAL